MASFVRDIFVACPPSRVFGVLSDLDRLPEFSEMIVAIRKGPGRPNRDRRLVRTSRESPRH